MREEDLVIIGAGPAGLSAAIEAARCGTSVMLIEENRAIGGKTLRETNGLGKVGLHNKAERRVRNRLLRNFSLVADKITPCLDTEVWGIVDQRVVEFNSMVGPWKGRGRVRGKKLIISVGAHEREIPFPGWTLPGVFTVGGLNSLVKRGILPGKEFLVAGSGPLQIILANNLIRIGAKISAIVEAFPLKRIALQTLKNSANIEFLRFRSACEFLINVRRQKVPVYLSHILSAVQGVREAQKAVIVKVDSSWKPIIGTEKEIRADTIAVGYGLVPSVDLTRLCGCEHQYDDRLGYWRVVRNKTMETTVSGVFVAGDGARVLGYSAAIEEGKVAGLEASVQLGHIERWKAEKKIRRSCKRLRRLRRTGQVIDTFSAPRFGILEIISADTVVCRCEEVSLEDICSAICEGALDVNEIKRRTRVGMGHCQGRFCDQVMNELIWKLTGRIRHRSTFTPRFPARPIPLKSLVG